MVLPCGSNPKVTIRADQHSEHLGSTPNHVEAQIQKGFDGTGDGKVCLDGRVVLGSKIGMGGRVGLGGGFGCLAGLGGSAHCHSSVPP